jgi:hypothetical protein
MENSMEENLWENHDRDGKQHQEGPVIAAEYLEANY